MSEEMMYKLNIEDIKTSFVYSPKGLTHSHGKKCKLLPYPANDKTLVSKFDGVVGAFSRKITGKELSENFDSEKFVENVCDKIGDYDGATSKEVFKDVVKTMFVDEGKLMNFNIKTINYIAANNQEDKLGKFIASILFSDELKADVDKHYDKDVENILYKLVLSSLPELKTKRQSEDEFKCYVPFIKDLFIEDFKFLINHEELYKESLKRFIEYYYLYYISQMAMKLSKFEEANLTQPEKIYFTLDWESTSKNRTAYKFGWDLLKNSVNSLFAHAITLELLNHHGLDKQLGYTELFELFNEQDENEVADEVIKVYKSYTDQIGLDFNWSGLKFRNVETGNKAFDEVHKLFEAVEYQFINSSRNRAYEAYRNWFIRFVYDNFSKKRGQLGYNLNITEEDIILMTKICIKDNERIKLNTLFDEFELRGLLFDRDSKLKIIQLFEKLNILEKKSDSGDAQYVRSIL